MYKKIKFIFLIVSASVLATSNCLADDKYYVMHIQGIVKLATTNKAIKIGDSFDRSDKLNFSSNEAFADVLSLKDGRVVLRSPKSKYTENEESEAFYLVKYIIAPKTITLNTRGGFVNNIIELRKLFSKSPYLLLGGESIISINPASFPMNDETFFFVSYSYNGELVNKKLSFDSDKLVLSYKEIFSINGKLIKKDTKGNFDLIYYNTKNQEQTKVSTVKYFVPDLTKIRNEIKVMSKVYGQASDKYNLNKHVLAFLVDRYGYASEDDVARLINEI